MMNIASQMWMIGISSSICNMYVDLANYFCFKLLAA